MTRRQLLFIYLHGCHVFLINLFPSWSQTFGPPLWSCYNRYMFYVPNKQTVFWGQFDSFWDFCENNMYFVCQWLYIILQVLDINKFCIILLAYDCEFFLMVLIFPSCAYTGESPTTSSFLHIGKKQKLVIDMYYSNAVQLLIYFLFFCFIILVEN